MSLTNIAGWIAGAALSPLTASLSAVRQSRMFHPAGVVCRAEARVDADVGPARLLAERLSGPALLRWSSAWWKRGEWADVLGCAIRFGAGSLGTESAAGDQDLLLATIQRPWTMAFAPWSTRQHDFLENVYFGVSPFEVDALGRIDVRLRADAASAQGSRAERLLAAVRDRRTLRLEWAPYVGPIRRPPPRAFSPLVRLDLEGLEEIDQRALRFDPFRCGRGLRPVGFVHNMRRASYAASQAARPSRSQHVARARAR